MKPQDLVLRRSQQNPEVRHGQALVPTAEGGVVPVIKEIVLRNPRPQYEHGSCQYGDMWNPENRSHAVVIGYVNSDHGREYAEDMAMNGEDVRKLRPSAIIINYSTLR